MKTGSAAHEKPLRGVPHAVHQFAPQINEERRRGKEFIEDSADALSLFCTSVIYNFKYVGDGGTKIISVQIIY